MSITDASQLGTVAAGSKTRIVLVENHAILRDGLRALLEMEGDLTVVGSVGDAAAAVALVRPAGTSAMSVRARGAAISASVSCLRSPA